MYRQPLGFIMYQFYGSLGSPEGNANPRYLKRLLEKRAKRLAKWYAYIKRNKKLGQALSVLFGALELVIMEGVRSATKIMPSAHSRFMRFLDGKWGSKIVPLNVHIDNVSTSVLPSQQILEIAKRTPIRSLNWCYCYRTYGKKFPGEKDRYSCLALGWGQNLDAINALAKHDPSEKIGKNLTYEELEQKLKEWNDQGYVHQLIFFPSPDYFYIICACNPDFCLTLSNTRKWGFPAVVKSDFIAEWTPAKCQQCQTCIKRCHFGAMHLENGKVSLNKSRCVGCGLCVTKCQSGAVQLVPRIAKPANKG
nr:4Fe-4S binding protein [Candidatus Sigynarchaeota archaeon]